MVAQPYSLHAAAQPQRLKLEEAAAGLVTRLGFRHLGKLGIAPYLIKLHVIE